MVSHPSASFATLCDIEEFWKEDVGEMVELKLSKEEWKSIVELPEVKKYWCPWSGSKLQAYTSLKLQLDETSKGTITW